MSSFIKVLDFGMKSLLYTKFEDIMGLTNINKDLVLAPKEVAQRLIGEKRGKQSVDFISLWRDMPRPSWERQRTPVARHGMYMAYTDGHHTDMVNVKAYPVDLNYVVHFWTLDLDKVMQVSETYALWQQNDPNLNINYNDIYPLEIDMHFGQMMDESPLEAMFEKGVYFVLSAPIALDAWIFELDSDKTIKKIVISIYDESVTPAVLLSQQELVAEEESGT